MGERKVLNKYIPADFDPKLVPRGSKPKDDLIPVRMMLPFTIQCSTCSNFMYRGRKFNSKKEPVTGSEGKYLGIQRYRFYIKCAGCSRPLTFLTDPKNADYEMESGGTRNYEVHKDKEQTEEDINKELALQEKEDPMKALENRVLASQKEMADLDNLDEIKAMNMRHVKMLSGLNNANGPCDTAMAVLLAREGKKLKEQQEAITKLTEEDEELVKSIQFGKSSTTPSAKPKKDKIIRVKDQDEQIATNKRSLNQIILEQQQDELLAKVNANKTINNNSMTSRNPLIRVKRKRVVEVSKSKPPINESINVQTNDENSEPGDALGLLGGYDSSDSD